MATVKVGLDKQYRSKAGTFPVGLKMSHLGVKRFQPSGYSIEERYFKDGQVRSTHRDAIRINKILDDLRSRALDYLDECRVEGHPIDLDAIFKESKVVFNEHLKTRAADYYKQHMVVHKRKLLALEADLLACFKEPLLVSQITPSMGLELNAYFLSKGKKGNNPNTRRKKFEMLAGLYAEVSSRKVNPFHVKINKLPVKKFRFNESQILQIEQLQLTGNTELAVDMFLFAYHIRGARFENVVTMKCEYIIDGKLEYRQNKGKNLMSIPLDEPVLQRILAKYAGKDPVYIFPALSATDKLKIKAYEDTPTDPRNKELYKKVIESKDTNLNKYLTPVLKAVSPKRATFHTARHSWAQNMRKRGLPTAFIQEALGHSSVAVTERYFETLEDDVLDEQIEKAKKAA